MDLVLRKNTKCLILFSKTLANWNSNLFWNYYIKFKVDIRKNLLCIQTKNFNNGPGMYKKNIF